MLPRLALILVLTPLLAVAADMQQAETGASIPAQAAADQLRSAAGAEIAFLPAGLIRDVYQKNDLSSMLQYPTDDLVVLKITGLVVRQAIERSLSLYPQPNPSFLQLSGMEVTFSAPIGGAKISSILVSGAGLQNDRVYEVAMPSSLARGGLGYFRLWDKKKIDRTASKNCGDTLKGKAFVESSPRWVLQSF
ncbi:MAG: 5'-nucleotidase C-terminal domain-containing protein [Armatimonadetes bacterium]|nr:5'-nucleotidase C-terminal domain-containing protein [Armatimonadota bacterium]